MNLIRLILAASDLSAPARHAAMRAAMLAADCGARLELLHVVELSALDRLRSFIGADSEAVQERLLAAARDELGRLAAEVGEPNRISPGVHLARGRVLTEIDAQAERLDASLLVLGARGAGFMQHALLGTTAERLLRITRRPILAVKQVAHAPYRHVLVALDFSEGAARALRFACALAPRARLTLLHVFEVPFEAKLQFAGVTEDAIQRYRETARQQAAERLAEFAVTHGAGHHAETVLAHGDAAPRIVERIEESDADLVVLGKHGTSVTEELLLGSVTKHVLAEAGCDVLVVR